MTTIHSSTSEGFEAVSYSYTEWRLRFLNIILRGACGVGLIVAIVGSINTLPILVALYALSYLVILVITFVPLSYRTRAIGFLTVLMAVAISGLLETGIRADARMFLLAFVVMAAMLFGRRGGIIAAGVSLIPIIIVGYLIVSGHYRIISTTISGNENMLTYVVAVLVLVLIETIILIGLDLLQRGFDTALRQSQRMVEVIQTERAVLEQRVEARTDQLRASAEVGRVATSILDADQLLEQVANLITTRFGFYYSAVFTLDEQGQFAVLRAATGEAGRILLERHHHLPVNRDSMVGAAIITQHSRIALDVGEGAVRFANPLLPNTRSEISLPLRVGERVMGALNVQSEDAGAFDEARAEVLQAMADQIAVALFNAESFARSEKQARALGLLNQLSRDLAVATSLENVATAVERTVTDLVGRRLMSLAQTTSNPQFLSLRQLTPNPSQPVTEPILIRAADSMIGICLEQGNTIYTPDLSQVIGQYKDMEMVYRMGLRSTVELPLKVGLRTVGTLNVGSEHLDAYTAEQIAQLEQVAAQVAVTLDSLNLAKQTQEALGELDAANRRLVGQAWSTYTQADGLIAAEWHNGEWSTTHSRQGMRAEAAPSQALVPLTQAISLPIKVRGATIGEFNVAPDAGQADWNSEEVAFAQALIDQVGQVLENARLLEETERSAQREKAVADAADKIHRSTDIEAVLHSAITELGRITGRRGISIQLGFDPTEAQRRQPTGNGQNTNQPRHEATEGNQ